jgi:hypothetical protein
MQTGIKCQLCQNDCFYDAKGYGITRIKCDVCGRYEITDSFENYIHLAKEKLHLISCVTRQYYENKTGTFRVTEKLLTDESEFQDKILCVAPKSVLDKADLLLQYIARKSSYPGDNVSIYPSQDYPICFCKNEKELRFYLNHLRDIGDIKAERTMRDYILSLTAEGWRKIESMERPNLESKQAFVAMWFDKSLDVIFTEGILSLKEDTGFEIYRVGQEPFNEKICDRIIADIRKSRFLIADVTGLRHAVFFEAGYAMGLGLPVIFTCREGTEIEGCFDTRQYNHIVWENAEDLKSKLKDRILATVGKTHS